MVKFSRLPTIYDEFFYLCPSSPSIRASIVCMTIFCSCFFRCPMRRNISQIRLLLSGGISEFPSSRFASILSMQTSFLNTSTDIAVCPPSIRLTVLTLIPASSARLSCDMPAFCLCSLIQFPISIRFCDSARFLKASPPSLLFCPVFLEACPCFSIYVMHITSPYNSSCILCDTMSQNLFLKKVIKRQPNNEIRLSYCSLQNILFFMFLISLPGFSNSHLSALFCFSQIFRIAAVIPTVLKALKMHF